MRELPARFQGDQDYCQEALPFLRASRDAHKALSATSGAEKEKRGSRAEKEKRGSRAEVLTQAGPGGQAADQA